MKGGEGGQIAFGKNPRQTKAGHVNVEERCNLIALQGARGRRRKRKRERERERCGWGGGPGPDHEYPAGYDKAEILFTATEKPLNGLSGFKPGSSMSGSFYSLYEP